MTLARVTDPYIYIQVSDVVYDDDDAGAVTKLDFDIEVQGMDESTFETLILLIAEKLEANRADNGDD